MKAFATKLWTDQAVFFATLVALGTAVVAAALTYSASHDPVIASAAGLGALGIGGTATHSVGSAVRNSTAPDVNVLAQAIERAAVEVQPVPPPSLAQSVGAVSRAAKPIEPPHGGLPS
jgi:predicted metal-binding membrane protein